MTQIDPAYLHDGTVRQVLNMLESGGHQALIVGGAVRNALLNQPATDIDIATDALPQTVQALAKAAHMKALPTGIEHGTITVIHHATPFEITTFRRDVETDGRHAVVAFSTSAAEDAQRRDFTINALYLDASGRVHDHVGGLRDIATRRLRFVGDARARITEDYLRILRFFRFHAWYGQPGHADPDGLAATAELAAGLERISKERIGAEMLKLLAAPDPSDALALMEDLGVLAHILPMPETGPAPSARLIPALIAAEKAQGIAPAPLRRLAALIGPTPPETFAAPLRLSKAQTRYLRDLSQAQDQSLIATAWQSGTDMAKDQALLSLAQGAPLAADWQDQILRASLAEFPLTAQDLTPAISGPALGQALRAAQKAWIDSSFSATHSQLIQIARQAAEHLADKKG